MVNPSSQISLAERFLQRLRRTLPLATFDTVIIAITYPLMLSVRESSIPFDRDKLFFVGAAILLTISLLYYFRAYHRVWQQTSGYSVLSLVAAVGISTIVMLVINLIVTPQPMPFSVLIAAHTLSLTGIVAIRYRSRLASGLNWRVLAVFFYKFPPPPATRVLIVGAGESGETLAWRLQHRFRKEVNYQVAGFIDDDIQKHRLLIEGLPVYGDRTQIPAVAQEHNIDLIIVAIHKIDGRDFRDILSYCEQTTARIKVVPDMLALLNENAIAAPIRDVEPEDLIGRSIIERHSSVDLNAVTHKRVLITGAAGSIGSELTRQMATYDPTLLILLDNNESGLHDLFIALKAQYPTLNIAHVLCDVTHKPTLRQVFDQYQPQIVFHTAAYKHVPLLEAYPHQALHVNVGGTLNMASLSHAHHIERFVMVSTDKAVNPSSVMGASKRLCEYIIHAYANMEDHSTYFAAVRFGNVLGSRGSVVPTFNKQINKGGPITVTDPHMTRYFMSISEAVNLVIHAACITQGDEIFLLRMGETVRILDIAERMIRLRGLRPYVDIHIEFVGMRPGEKLHEELHQEVENPGETIHPYIFKLSGWEHRIQPHAFLEAVGALISEGLPADTPPITALLSPIKLLV